MAQFCINTESGYIYSKVSSLKRARCVGKYSKGGDYSSVSICFLIWEPIGRKRESTTFACWSSDLLAMEPQQRGEPWFEDGNLILQADGNVSFRIHRGVLARQSEVFKDMLALPRPSALTPNGDECETVRMYDMPVELSNLLVAIYDGV